MSEVPDAERDRRGYYRSPVTLADYRRGKPPANKGKRYPAEPLTQREVLALLEACGRGPAGHRNRAMITVMWRSGLRCAEMLALYPKDIDLERGTIAVLHGKGDRSRTVGIDPFAAAVLERWLRDRRKLGVNGRDPVFCVISKPTIGKPVHDAYVRDLMKKLAVKAGIDKRVHPHGLRHTHAFELAGESLPIHYIRRQLGHANLAVTARYVEHLNPSDVVDAIRGRPAPDLDSAAAQRARSPQAPEPAAAPLDVSAASAAQAAALRRLLES